MGCCTPEAQSEDRGPEKEPFARGGEKDLSKGPLGNRHCTDVFCLVLFLVHWAVFLIVIFVGYSDGNPKKLYRPRDFRGGFCGLSDGGLQDHVKLAQAMNVTAAVDAVAKTLVCSNSAQEVLQAAWGAGSADYVEYLCTCCVIPCERCQGSLPIEDLGSGSQLQSSIGARMAEFTDPSQAGRIFSPGSSGSAVFDGTELLRQATKYFVPVCLSGSCAVSNVSELASSRTYTYSPVPESRWKLAWDRLAAGGGGLPVGAQAIQSAIQTQFTFQAMPLSRCPYPAQYCVPLPGVSFSELPGDYCAPELDASVVGAIGQSAAEALAGLGSASLAESSAKEAGAEFGDLLDSLDALAVVALWSFSAGLLFLVLLRFFVGCAVWAALSLVFLLLLLAGLAAFARSHQCTGQGLFDTGVNQATAVAIVAQDTVAGAVAGSAAVSEALSGNGADYRGRQQRTRSGRMCQRWDCTTTAMAASTNSARTCVHDHSFSPSAFPNSDLLDNYCRNPADAGTIWCYTVDHDKAWEICSPVGVITASCPSGYEVAGETSRKVLEISAYILWGLAAVWLLVIFCMYNRIRLAIAINKVAAMFIYHAPSVVLVPIGQIFLGAAYCILWVFCASFLLSQVPSGYTPTGYYSTWAEAYGTADTPGACTDKWPSGFVWRYGGDLGSEDDPCTGNRGDTTGITPRCWRCAPPRFALDTKFAYIFFSLHWGNALLIALGQYIVAGACATWFFTPRGQNLQRSPVPGAVRTAFRYHLGSLAFGAFIIALVEFVRYVCKYLEKQAKAQKNKVMVLVLKAVQCCIWMFERFLKFLNKNAYIQMAIMGTGFCTSAKTAFYLILRNVARFGTLALLGSIIHFIGFCFIMTFTALLGYFLVQELHPGISPLLPVLSYIAVGYLIAKLYMNVFGLAVDTLLQCFIAAEEMEEVSTFVPKPLLGLLPGRSKEAWTDSKTISVVPVKPK